MTTKPLCILIDDDESILLLVHSFVSQICPNFGVMTFLSSVEALEYLTENQADLIITDYRMLMLDGLQLTAAIRAGDPDVPILVMSGENIAEEAIARGANGFIEKINLSKNLAEALHNIGVRTLSRRRVAQLARE